MASLALPWVTPPGDSLSESGDVEGGQVKKPDATKKAKKLADVSRLDAEFHDRIVRAAGNRRLLLCWNSLRDQFALWLTQMQLRHEAVTHRTRQETVESHGQLLDAVRSGDAKQAAEVARRHVAGWIRVMPEVEQ